MKFIDCINNAVESGKIKPEKGKEAVDAYTAEFDRQKKAGLTDEEADAQAAVLSAESMTKGKALQAQRRMLEMKRAWDLQQKVDSVSEKRLGEFAERFMDENVYSRYETRLGQFHAITEDMIHKYRPRMAGLIRTSRGVDNIVREMFGQGTGDVSSKAMADALKEAAIKAAKYANRAGADIQFDPKKPYIPQMHSTAKMAGKKTEWIADHIRTLDWDNMKHFNDGQPIAPENRVKVLEHVFDTLMTNGYVRIKPGQRGARGISDRLSHQRFLHYKDADSWLDINKKYGDGNLIGQYMSYLDTMARDIAVIDVFGPNPENLRVYLGGALKQRAGEVSAKAQNTKAISKLEDGLSKFEETYRIFTGANAASKDNMVGTIAQSARNLVTSAFLGTTAPMAFAGDLAKAIHRGSWEKTSPGKFLSFYAKNVLSGMTRREAVRAGLIAENALSLAMGQIRFTADFGGAKWSQYLADVALRASFLSPHTQVAKWASSLELMGVFADNARKGFDKIPFRELLEANGITREDWDIFRATNVHDPNGLHILRPDDMRVREDIAEERAIEIADKFMDLVNRERKRRVIESSLRAQATMGAANKAGTFRGEIMRTGAQLKNFGVTIMYQLLEDVREKNNALEGLSYFTTAAAALTFAAAMAMQFQQVAAGRDPLDMTTPNFWAAASLKGGGWGVLGDFAFSNVNRYGSGLGDMLAGPSAGFYNDFRNLTIGNFLELAQGDETNVTKEALDFGTRYAPGSTTWYAKLFFRRKLMEQLMLETDPKAARRYRQMERNARENYNQGYWWAPGDESPARAPDTEAIIGGSF